MDTTALQTVSPTLLRGVLEGYKKTISKGLKVFNSKDCSLDAWFKDEMTGETIRIIFQDLPDELRKGIHDYTTRLTAEKLLLESALADKKITP